MLSINVKCKPKCRYWTLGSALAKSSYSQLRIQFLPGGQREYLLKSWVWDQQVFGRHLVWQTLAGTASSPKPETFSLYQSGSKLHGMCHSVLYNTACLRDHTHTHTGRDMSAGSRSLERCSSSMLDEMKWVSGLWNTKANVFIEKNYKTFFFWVFCLFCC